MCTHTGSADFLPRLESIQGSLSSHVTSSAPLPPLSHMSSTSLSLSSARPTRLYEKRDGRSRKRKKKKKKRKLQTYTMEGIKKRSLKSYELFLYFVFLAGKKKIRPDLRCRTKKTIPRDSFVLGWNVFDGSARALASVPQFEFNNIIFCNSLRRKCPAL